MVDYSADDDSDEELGAYIYRTSHTAKFFREKEELARNNDKTSTNHNTRKSKRKKQLEAENTSVSSESKQRAKKKRKKYTCSHEGCTNQVRTGGVCTRHGAKVKTCKHEGCTTQARKGGVCTKHGLGRQGALRKKYTCSHEGCTNQGVKGGVCVSHGAKKKKNNCRAEDAPIMLFWEEYVSNTERRGRLVVMRDVQIRYRTEEFV